ncbi:MAG: quinol monooxygenase YgiN [Halioglobus sp.]|jgi:quinol monooxygenase YgiN
MVVVNAVIESTEADILALTEAVRVMEVASLAEAGCDDYTFSVEMSNPTTIRVTEHWDTLEALKAHFETEHMVVFQAAMGAHPPKGVNATFFEAQEIPPPFG